VRGPEYFREQEARKSIKIIEKQIEEQMEKAIPDAIDNLLSGLFKTQKIDFEVKIWHYQAIGTANFQITTLQCIRMDTPQNK